MEGADTLVTMKEIYPAPRSRHTALVSTLQQVIMFGGGGKNKIFDDLWLLDIETLTWMQPHCTGKKPSGRWGHSATLVQQTMYVYGGVYDSKMLNELYANNIAL